MKSKEFNKAELQISSDIYNVLKPEKKHQNVQFRQRVKKGYDLIITYTSNLGIKLETPEEKDQILRILFSSYTHQYLDDPILDSVRRGFGDIAAKILNHKISYDDLPSYLDALEGKYF